MKRHGDGTMAASMSPSNHCLKVLLNMTTYCLAVKPSCRIVEELFHAMTYIKGIR